MDTKVEELCEAAQAGEMGKVRNLLGSGISANAKDRSGFPALHRCCIGLSSDSASLLLARGAAINSVDEYGDSALHYASHAGNADLVRILLAAGADALAISFDGRTPLSVAQEEGQQSIVSIFLDHLDTSGLRGKDSVDVDDRAAKQAHSGTNAYQRSVTQLGDAAYAGDVRAVHNLLSAGVDANGADADGFSALHRAACSGQLAVMELLLSHGADPNTRDVVGCTPLHYSAFCGHTDASYVLVSSGADTSRRNRDGLTAADVAKAEGRDRVLRLLSNTWTRAENLDFAHGVVLEGELRAKRASNSPGVSLFRWKQKYAVLSKHYRALFLWSGTAASVDGPVTRLRLDNIESVQHDAKSNSKAFAVRPTQGEVLELAAASGDDATIWVGAIRALQVALQEEDSKAVLLKQLMSGDRATARVLTAHSQQVPSAPVEQTKTLLIAAPLAVSNGALSSSVIMAALPPAPSISRVEAPTSAVGAEVDDDKKDKKKKKEKKEKKEKKYGKLEQTKAATLIQRTMRGWKVRKLLIGWVRVVDDADGDIYWYNTKTKASSWFPPGRDE